MHKKKDGTIFPAEVNSVLYTDHKGGLKTCTIIRDLSETQRQKEESERVNLKYLTLFQSFPYGITVSDSKGTIAETNPAAEKLLGMATDITDLINYETELQNSRMKFSTIFNNNPAGIVVTSFDDGIILDCNDSFEKISGYSRAEILGKKSLSTSFWVSGESQRSQYVALLKKDGFFKNLKIKFNNKTSEIRHGIFSAEVVQFEGNSCIITTMFDITELVITKEQLQETQDHYKILFERSHDAIFVVDMATGRYLEANHAAEVLTGRSRSELVTLTTKDITPDGFKERLEKGRGLRDRPFETLKYVDVNYVRPNGSKREAILTIVAGEGGHAFGIAKDVTDERRTQKQLQQAQKMESIGTLAGGIAHDFNNILGPILGYAEMVQEDSPVGSSMRKDIGQVIKASLRAKDLVKQILAFSRLVEDQKIPLKPAVIVKEAITLLRSSLPTTITIKQDIDTEAGMVLADPTQIHQIVMNLATNAFHAMEVKGGILTISLQKKILSQEDYAKEPDLQPGTFMQLLIKDTGEGILPEIREKIFDPFFTTKEVGQGTGLGLSMVYSIVKGCHGAIACDSRVGEGTEFRILLPVLEGHAEEEAESTALIPHGKEHILFIDDEEVLAELGQVMLERLGYHVTTRGNSLDALTTFQNQPDTFDLIITDQTMPGMTGDDLARRILQIRPQMPIILCTGYSSQINEDKAKASGIKGFAYKPLAKKDIAELIRKVLDGRSA